MQQASLIIIADHTLDIKDKESIISMCLEMNIDNILQDALNIQANLENYKLPDKVQKLIFKEVDVDGDIHFSVNEINIRISKRIIQFDFPFLFRVIVDYIPLRNAYYKFLHYFLAHFQTTEIIEFPSFWGYKAHEIKNEFHSHRLVNLQHKIVHKSNSYKRNKLNLTHCLGYPDADALSIMKRKYRVWIVIEYKDLLIKSNSETF